MGLQNVTSFRTNSPAVRRNGSYQETAMEDRITESSTEVDTYNLIEPERRPRRMQLGSWGKVAFGAGNVLIEMTNSMWMTYTLLYFTDVIGISRLYICAKLNLFYF